MAPALDHPDADLVRRVLRHYAVGDTVSIEPCARGSRKSPKFVVTTDQGRFMLKRRAKGKDDPLRVAFAHALQNHLAAQGFPLPRLIGTIEDNNSILQLEGRVYELFAYVDGKPYHGGLSETYQAGLTLAVYHSLLRDYEPQWTPPRGSYHDSDLVREKLNAIPTTLTSHDSVAGQEGSLLEAIQDLREIYDRTCSAAAAFGVDRWRRQVVHNDYHPGNVLFRDKRVVAVLDFDSARILPPAVDVANGALQFSIVGGKDPSEWPDFVDETRMKRFLRGYDDTAVLSVAELQACPFLMIEALIAEAAVPIAATGEFGDVAGWRFLQMVHRKARWMEHHADRLGRLLHA